MSQVSSIEWTDATWNPITGCTKMSAGCLNCYAARLAATRLSEHSAYQGLSKIENGRGAWTGEVRLHPDRLHTPLTWRKPRKVFVCSMSDLFHPSVPLKFIAAVFDVMASWALICRKSDCDHNDPDCWHNPGHVYQILTKRANRMRVVLTEELPWYVFEAMPGDSPLSMAMEAGDWPLPNVWGGVSVENQAAADERIPDLVASPFVKRFISAEPLLDRLDLAGWRCECGADFDPLDGHWRWDGRNWQHYHGYPLGHVIVRPTIDGIDGVYAGGETGPNARTLDPNHLRHLQMQCETAGVAFLFKQWGSAGPPSPALRDFYYQAGWNPKERNGGRVLDGRVWDQQPGEVNHE